MRHFLIISATILFILPLSAQNGFFDFTDIRFHELIPLRTDSIFITAGTQLREIGFTYDTYERTLQIRETRSDSSENLLQKITNDYIHSPGQLVFTTKTETIIPFQNVYFDRLTIDSAGGNMISRTGESWNGSQWNAIFRDTFIYNASGDLIEHSSKLWDFSTSSFKPQFTITNVYNAQEQLLSYHYLSLDILTGDTLSYVDYLYDYYAADKLANRLKRFWNNGVLQYDFYEHYIYDANDLVDSLKIEIWDPWLNIWELKNVMVLDDSPEQQTTKEGKYYQLNGQSQWYLERETTFTPGPQVYSDHPIERLLKTYYPPTGMLRNDALDLTTYTDLPDGTVKGDYKQDDYINASASWITMFHVEAWQRKIGSTGTLEPQRSTIPRCGLPNPLPRNNVALISEKFIGNGNLQANLYATDGRQVSEVSLNSGMIRFSQSEIGSGIYMLIITDEGSILCTQKVIMKP